MLFGFKCGAGLGLVHSIDLTWAISCGISEEALIGHIPYFDTAKNEPHDLMVSKGAGKIPGGIKDDDPRGCRSKMSEPFIFTCSVSHSFQKSYFGMFHNEHDILK